MSTHYSEDDLTLYYYGEVSSTALERHLQTCAACAALYREISATLSMVMADPVPERGEQYGLEVWQRIRHQLPPKTGFGWFKGFKGFDEFGGLMGFAAAAAVLMLAAFIAGRSMNPAKPSTVSNPAISPSSGNPATADSANPVNPDSRQRILLTSVADHLDRSERVLTDIMNAPDAARGGDISIEQRWAEDLLTTSRLYRQDALAAGERSVATVLDDLERNLLEIVHSPSKISAADLEQLRRRIDAAALLFKVRVMSDQLRDRDAARETRPTPRASTSKSS